MASSTLVVAFTVVILSMISIIFSHPQEDLVVRPVADVIPDEFDDSNKVVVQELMDRLDLVYPDMGPEQRANIAQLFNLTAALAGAPRNTSALTFIPLITLLFG